MNEATVTAREKTARASERAATIDGSLREIIARHTASTTVLAALGAALHARVTGRALDPAMRPHVDDVLRALGVRDELDRLSPAELRPLVCEIRTYIFTGAELVRGGRSGWAHTDAEILSPPAMSRRWFRACSRVRSRRPWPGWPSAWRARPRASSTSAPAWPRWRSRWRGHGLR